MQGSQIPARAGPPPVQSGDVYTPSRQAYHTQMLSASKPTQAGIAVGLAVPQNSSSRPHDLASIDLTVDSDDNSK